MKKSVMLLITVIVISLIGHSENSRAAELGGQLKLSDSKQELKEIMKQIKQIASYSFEYTPKGYPGQDYKGDQTFDFSGCNVKTDQGHSVYDHYYAEYREYSLRNIELVEIQSNSNTGNNARIWLKTRDFEKKVITKSRGDQGRDERYVDSADLLVPESDATAVIDLLEKAIKLCADK